jgi:hypothetical protein
MKTILDLSFRHDVSFDADFRWQRQAGAGII